MTVWEQHYTWIPWREPLPVTTPDGTWLTCRICTAENGLKAAELPACGFETREEYDQHMRTEHPA